MMLRFANLLIGAVLLLIVVGTHDAVYAHEEVGGGGVNHHHHDHHHHDGIHHHHYYHHNHHHPFTHGNNLRRLGGASSTTSICNDDEPTYTVGSVTYACKSEFRARGGMCGTATMSPEEQVMAMDEFTAWKKEKDRISASSSSSSKGRRRLGGCGNCVDWNTTVITIPTYFHAIHSGITGKKYTYTSNPSYIRKQIKVLNTGFRGAESRFYEPYPGGRSYDRYDVVDSNTKLQFCLAGTTATDNAAWYYDYSLEKQMKSALKKGGSESLNVYLNTAGGLLGWATFPRPNEFVMDGIVLLNDSMPGGDLAKFNEGDTLTHEVGHWLQLLHTHERECDGPGDYMHLAPKSPKYVSRKSNEDGMTFECPVNLNNCVGDCGMNPIHNFMAYTDDSCMDQFSPGQKVKLQQAWETYRHKLGYSEHISLAADGYSCILSGTPLTTAPTPAPSTKSPTSKPSTKRPTVKSSTSRPTVKSSTGRPTAKPKIRQTTAETTTKPFSKKPKI